MKPRHRQRPLRVVSINHAFFVPTHKSVERFLDRWYLAGLESALKRESRGSA